MSQAMTHGGWTIEAYLDWEGRQEGRYELVDGQVRAMVGGTGEHDTISNNLRWALRNALQGGPCRVQGPELKLHAHQNVRYPDALIDCGVRPRGSLFAAEPVVVFEVLSKSTAWIDQTIKLRDYDLVASIKSYVLISQDEPRVLVYRRDENRRLNAAAMELLEGLDASLSLADPVVTIPFRTLYEGIAFEA